VGTHQRILPRHERPEMDEAVHERRGAERYDHRERPAHSSGPRDERGQRNAVLVNDRGKAPAWSGAWQGVSDRSGGSCPRRVTLRSIEHRQREDLWWIPPIEIQPAAPHAATRTRPD